jgi:hypothetical protein
MAIDLVTELLGNCADGEGVFHVTIVGIGGGHEFFVGVDGIVVMEVVAQFFVELGEEAILDQGGWGSIYTWLTLRQG